MNSFWDSTSTCFQCVLTVASKWKHVQAKAAVPWVRWQGEAPSDTCPRLGLGRDPREGNAATVLPRAPHCAPPRRELTALVSYRTSFWTELMMGAAAAGMVGGSWGSHRTAPGRGPGCGSLQTAPRGPQRRQFRPPTPDPARKTPLGH